MIGGAMKLTVSIQEWMAEKAKRRARQIGFKGFSQYLQWLIVNDFETAAGETGGCPQRRKGERNGPPEEEDEKKPANSGLGVADQIRQREWCIQRGAVSPTALER